MLLIVAFLTGAAVMAFEVLGFRVMAVEFGSLDVINGSLIGAVLTALSGGYYLGGILADRFPRAGLLGVFIILAGINIEFVPQLSVMVGNPKGFIGNRDITGQWGPLMGAMILFAPASLLLAMTSPFVIRVLAPSREVLGRVAGRVYAISTVGSIFGTLFTTFYLMPAEWVGGHMHALQIAGGVTILTGLLPIVSSVWTMVWSVWVRRSNAAITILALISLCSISSFAQADERVIYRRDSTYHHIEVVDTNYGGRRLRLLRFDNSEQSGMDLDDPDAQVWPYTDYMHLAWVFKSDPKHALLIGLGGGTIQMRFHRDYRDLKIDIAELDPVVESVAKRYFAVKEDDRLKIHISDGRQYLRRTENKYDLIVMDAYHGSRYGPTLPFTLCTREFFQIVEKRLTDDGVFAFNLIGQIEGNVSLQTRSIIKTMRAVFPNVYVFPVDLKRLSLTAKRNIIVICTKDKKELSKTIIYSRAKKLVADRKVTLRDLASYAADLYDKELDSRNVRILTDDTAQPDRLLIP